MKNIGIFAAGYVLGFATLFVLMLIFGDYGAETNTTPAPVVAQVEQPTSTPAPSNTPVPSFTPTATPVPPSPTPLPTWTPLPAATPMPVGMNQDLVVDGIRWKAIAVEEVGNTLHSENQFAEDLSTPGKYVRVTMEIENRQKEPTFYESPHLMDSQGRRYNSLGMAGLYVSEEQDCSSLDFNPGVTAKCADLFEVAADAGGYKLVANNFESFDAQEGIIDLH